MRTRIRKDLRLFSLYSKFYINQVTILVLFIALILVLIFLILNSGYKFSEYAYVVNKENFINDYFTDSLFFLNILNAVFITYLVGYEANSNVSKFDILFTSNNSREQIYISKVLASFVVIAFFLIGEYFLLLFVPVIIYPDFVFSFAYGRLLLYQLIQNVFLLLLGHTFILLVKNVFVSLVVFLWYFASRILIDSGGKIEAIINFFYPHIYYFQDLTCDFKYGIIYVLALICGLLILNCQIFSIKEIK